MSKRGTTGLVIVVVVIAIVAIGTYFLLSHLNSLVAGVIEKQGSKVTETNVAVSGVKISIKDGSGSIQGLSVASPAGYHAPEAFTLGDITVDIDTGSLRDNPIVIDEVHIKAPVVHAEFKKDGSSNIDDLRKRVESYAGGSSGGSSSGGGGSEKRIRIARFVFEGGKIEADASALGVKKQELTLPAIRLTNLGGTKGAAPDAIAKQVVAAVTRQVTQQIAQSEVHNLIQDKLGGSSVGEKAKELLKKIH